MLMSERLLEQLLESFAERVAQRLLELQREQQAAAAEASPWMNVASAAAFLGWPKQRLYKLSAEGAIPHYKHDGRLLFNRHELDRWLGGFRQSGDWIEAEKRAMCP